MSDFFTQDKFDSPTGQDIRDARTQLKNADCNKKSVLECESNWQVKVYTAQGATKWLPETDLIEVADGKQYNISCQI